jgi:hypothetical protein
VSDYATLLRDHVTLTCRSVDRIFLQAYVPKLQTAGWVCQFLRWQRGFAIPSSAAFGKIGDWYWKEVGRYAEAKDIPIVYFAKGDNKEEIARPLIDAAEAAGGDGRVVLIGIAQEKAPVWRSWKAKGQQHAAHPPHGVGPADGVHQPLLLLPVGSGLGWRVLEDQRVCPVPDLDLAQRPHLGPTPVSSGGDRLHRPGQRVRLLQRPGAPATHLRPARPRGGEVVLLAVAAPAASPFTVADMRAGYTYELAFRQFEVSDTRVFDRPAAGRGFFEGVIRDHLDVGRPSQVALTFDRRITSRTPGTFRTKVITRGVDPQLICYYKASRLKLYFKDGRALRTETVIGDTRDFGIGRRVNAQNWTALRAVGDKANQRLCDAQAADAQPAPDAATLNQVTRPARTDDGQRTPALRFGDPRVTALMSAIVGFCHLTAGFNNKTLTDLMSSLSDTPYTRRQATYDLRRLRRKDLIERLPHRNRYQLTSLGRRVAVLFTKAYGRVLAPGLATLDPHLPADIARRDPLATAWRTLDRALDRFIANGLAAA